MKKLLGTALLFIVTNAFSQNFISAYQSRVNQVSQTNVNTYLQEFGNLGVKRTGSTANTNALNWIKNKYLSYGYQNSQIQEQSFSFTQNGSTVTSKNLIITKQGTVYPDTYVIVCGHFDSIVGPGVNDNGSGTTAILEAARILLNVPTEYSIKFIHFSGEEQGLYGSYAYVNNVVNATNPKMKIKLVFNLDQVGGKIGNNNNTIYCDVDQSAPNSNNAASQTVATELANCTTLYTSLQTAYDPAYSTDYVPFMQNGEVVTGFYEYRRSYNEHTTNDTYANVDKTYVYNVTKAAVGAIQHFAIAPTVLATSEAVVTPEELTAYPIPTSDVLNLKIPNQPKGKFTVMITDLSGKRVHEVENTLHVSVNHLPNGTYIATVRFTEGHFFKKKFTVNK